MPSASSFLEALEESRDDPLLRHVSGTIRFDLTRDDGSIEPWLVTLTDGTMSVSHRRTRANCVAKMDESLFVAMTLGEVNAVAAALRGEIEVQGEIALLLALQRLFPGPPADRRSGTETVGRSR